jgi:hypothetical protein
LKLERKVHLADGSLKYSEFEPDEIVSNWRAVLATEETRMALFGRGRVYTISDSQGAVIYVGKASSPRERLLEHVGHGVFTGSGKATRVGKYINAHLPASLDWQVSVYELEASWEDNVKWVFNPFFCNDYTHTAASIVPDPLPD